MGASIFNEELQEVRRAKTQDLALQTFFAVCGVVGTFAVPLGFPNSLGTVEKLLSHAFGGTGWLALAVYAADERREKLEKMSNSFQKAEEKLTEGNAQNQLVYQLEAQRIGFNQILRSLVDMAPPTAQAIEAQTLQIPHYVGLVQSPPAQEAPPNEFAGVTIPASTAPPFTAVDWEAQAIESAMPPVRDCAYDIASLDGHVALVSKTRSGKTTLLIAAIAHAQALGHEVFLIDGKGDDRLRALQGVHYLQCNSSSKVPAMDEMINHVLNALKQRQAPGATISHPISFFVDENNLIRDSVGDTEEKKSDRAAAIEAYDRKLKRVLLQGAAAKIYLRLSGHTSRVEDWGWNTGVLDSLTFAAIARNGSYESVEDLITHQFQGSQKELARHGLSEIQRIGEIESPIMLTKQQPWGFYRLPDYSKVRQPEGVAPSSGYDTKKPSSVQIQPLDSDLLAASYDPRSNPAKTAIAEMVDWMLSYKGDPGSLTRDAIAAKFKAETGEYLKGEALDGLIDILKAEIRRVSGG